MGVVGDYDAGDSGHGVNGRANERGGQAEIWGVSLVFLSVILVRFFARD